MVKLSLSLETDSDSQMSEPVTSENPPFPDINPVETVPDIDDAEKFHQELERQFAAIPDRRMLNLILHNQVAISATLQKFEAMADMFGKGLSAKDMMKMVMGKGN